MLYQINGVEDHLHILSDLHPTIALADYVKDIKVSSSVWIKKKKLFPGFTGWTEGYGAFTYSYDRKANLVNYIKRQEEHHKKVSFLTEYIRLLEEFSITYDPTYI